MSEGMGIEKAASNLAELKGYNTKIRVPVKLQSSKRSTPSDLDVIGVNADGEVLVVECKAHGSPDTYKNYNTKGRLGTIEKENNAVKTLSDIVNDTEKPLDPLFENQEFEIDELWYVFKGYFNEDEASSEGKYYDSKKDFEGKLEDHLGVNEIKLIPSHELFCEIAREIPEDMMKRRKRYGSPIKEAFRHLAAAYNQDPAFLDDLVNSFQKNSNYLDDS